MKARLLDSQALVYDGPDLNSGIVTQLLAGHEVELRGVKKKAGKDWVGVTLADGRRGYLPGDTKLFHIQPVTLLQKEVAVYAEPSTASVMKAQYKKPARFFLVGIANQDGKTWVRIRDAAGQEGFIDGKTSLKREVEVTKAMGGKNMLYGALWCIGGIVVTVATLSAASSGGTYVVAWGAVIFGGLQFFQGLYQYLTAPA
jgi:hypothetical protein